ncbi:hypothetical protein GCM10009731_50560 [Streptomyces globosus]
MANILGNYFRLGPTCGIEPPSGPLGGPPAGQSTRSGPYGTPCTRARPVRAPRSRPEGAVPGPLGPGRGGAGPRFVGEP